MMAEPLDIDDIDEEGAPDQSQAEIDLLQRALQRFDSICSAQQEERALALADRRFASIAGAQWEGDWEQQFANSIMVEVNKTSQGVEKIIADYRANRVTVNFRSVGKGADQQTAETLDGLFRADVYNSKGGQAFDNAFDEAVNGGIGAWRLTNALEDEYDPENDGQRISFMPIVDADQSVFWDMNSQTYDKADAEYAFVITAMVRTSYQADYDDDPSGWPDEILKTYYDWYTPDVVRVCEYYEVRHVTAQLRIFQHRATGEERREWAKDLDADALATMELEGWREVRQRMAKRRQVWKSVLTGGKVLEKPKLIAGDCIPIVPVYGKRWFIDNMERSRGHVRLAKDPQRIYNAQISKLTETAAIAPTERPIFTPEQMQGHAQSWAEANINRAPYALINAMIGTDGNPLPAGPIGTVTPPQLSPVLAALIQITANDIAELTSADDGADEVKSNVSAEAMDIAATRVDAKSGIYMDNMRQSMQRCGEIYLSMARDVYCEDGREVETMSEDGEHGTATLAEPYTDDKGRFLIRNDLAKGKYKVISDVTEATTTRRDKTVKTLVNVAQIAAGVDPELAAVCLATAVINMDGEGMTDMQEYVRAKLVQQGAVKPTEEEKATLEAAQQEQRPDPQSLALEAVAKKETALADKAVADTGKSVADTKLAEANTVKTLADAQRIRAETSRGDDTHEQGKDQHKMGMVERVKGLFERKDRPEARP